MYGINYFRLLFLPDSRKQLMFILNVLASVLYSTSGIRVASGQPGRVLSVVENGVDDDCCLFDGIKNGKRESAYQGTPEIFMMFDVHFGHTGNRFNSNFDTIKKIHPKSGSLFLIPQKCETKISFCFGCIDDLH